MDLEHDERLLDTHTHLGPQAVCVAGLGITAILWYGLQAWALLVVPLLVLAVLITAAFAYRRVLLTDRRIVEYRPVLAALARRAPVFAALEVEARRVISLDDVLDARTVGTSLVLHTPRNGEHHLHVHQDGVAVRIELQLKELVRRRMLDLARRRPISVRVEAPSERPALRCPYCHDALGQDEAADAAVCEGCGAAHHAECFEIHRGCSASGCGARTARARAREQT